MPEQDPPTEDVPVEGAPAATEPELQVDGLEGTPGGPSTPQPTAGQVAGEDVNEGAFSAVHGHVVRAPATSGWVDVTALAVMVGLVVALVALFVRWRRQLEPGGLHPRRAIPAVVGLALAILLFPGAADEFGTGAQEGIQASLRVVPAAVDAGLRCTVSDAPREQDGCDHHGVMALPGYLGQATSLVMSEARLARSGAVVVRQDLETGLKRAAADRVWGLRYVPQTAMAYGADSEVRSRSLLQLSTVVLFIVTTLVGAAGWRFLVGILRESADGALSEAQREERRKLNTARIKSIALMTVLGGGAYLAFAALTALGPFMEARRAGGDGALQAASERITSTETTWLRAGHGLDVADTPDLQALDDALIEVDMLRRQTLRRSFDQLEEEFGTFEAGYRPSWRQVHAWAAYGERDHHPRISEKIDGVSRADARQLWQQAREARAAMQDVWTFADEQVKATVAGMDPRVYARLHLDFDRHIETLGDIKVALVETQTPSTQSVRSQIVDSVEQVLVSTIGFKKALALAQRDYAGAEAIAQDKHRQLVEAMNYHRDVHLNHAEALIKLDRKLVGQQARASQLLQRERDDFSFVQREGPGWLDRLERLSGWYEQAHRDARFATRSCAEEVLASEARHRRAATLAVGAVQSHLSGDGAAEGAGSRIPLFQLRIRVASFEDALLGPIVDGKRAARPLAVETVPDCVARQLPMPDVPDRASTSTTYGAAIGVLSGWLMQSGSLDIVMLAGMLGFGLLGSGLSRIVRRKSRSSEGRTTALMPSGPDQVPLVDDVPSVVFQGLGATLVVYLAGVGGISAISATPPSLDPHVLMLSCFVASVFSEDVWRSARKWMKDQPAAP